MPPNSKNDDKRNQLTDIILSPKKPTDEPGNVISRLIRQVFADLNLSPHQFTTLLNQYLNDPINGFDTQALKSSENGNIKKEIPRPNATIKTLVKLIRIMNPEEVSFSLGFKWHNGQKTTHVIDIGVPSDRQSDALNMLFMESEPVKEKTTVSEIYEALDALNDLTPINSGRK